MKRILWQAFAAMGLSGVGLGQAYAADGPLVRRSYDVTVRSVTEAQELFEVGYMPVHLAAEVNTREQLWYQFLLTDNEVAALQTSGHRVVLTANPGGGAGGGGTCSAQPKQGSYCMYGSTSGRCRRSLKDELAAAPLDYPPVGYTSYVRVVNLGKSAASNTDILGVRLGNSSVEKVQPQIFVVAGQHAREWFGPEVMMRVFRTLAKQLQVNPAWRGLFGEQVVMLVPVANPDGYDYSFGGSNATRMWRKNRRSCAASETAYSPQVGVDLNRNSEFSFGQPGADTDCIAETYRGLSGLPESETQALVNYLTRTQKRYPTVFSLNVHTYGNFALVPGGYGDRFSPCTTNTNCSAPDLGAYFAILGTSNPANALLIDPVSKAPYIVNDTYRAMYAASGLLADDLAYRATDGLAVTLELSNTPCGFQGESFDESMINAHVDEMVGLIANLLSNAVPLYNGSYFDKVVGRYTLPHIHRQQVAWEYPTLRVAARNTLPWVDIRAPKGYAPQTGTLDTSVVDGVAYRSWLWRPDQPYIFPPVLAVCEPDTRNCEEIQVDDENRKAINLCSPESMIEVDGWKFTGQVGAVPGKECYWEGVTDESVMTRWPVDLSSMRGAYLYFSMSTTTNMKQSRVYVSNNGFKDCTTEVGTGCRIVDQEPYPDNYDLRWVEFRTHTVDITDFDGQRDVQVRFEVAGAKQVKVYDVVIVGWRR